MQDHEADLTGRVDADDAPDVAKSVEGSEAAATGTEAAGTDAGATSDGAGDPATEAGAGNAGAAIDGNHSDAEAGAGNGGAATAGVDHPDAEAGAGDAGTATDGDLATEAGAGNGGTATDGDHPDADAEGTGQASVGPMHRKGRYEPGKRQAGPNAFRRYLLVTKPRIIELLLITTVPAMVVAAEGWPGTWLVIATVLGGTMSAGSANAFNNVIDRDIDRIMARTSQRPTAVESVSVKGALTLAIVLGIAGFAFLAVFVNVLAASLATFAIFFYVFVYTLGLKRRTPQAVVIGGIAGCMPVMTGWAAVPDASFADPRPWLLFGIMFWWQAPHFWALAMKYREDYARAGLPMLPVVHGNNEATRQILLHSYLLFAIVLLAVAGMGLGWLFNVPILLLTVFWLVLAHRLRKERTIATAMKLFHYSTIYVALTFIAAAVAAVIEI